MFFHIDPTNGLAIYEQVARQVMFAVAGGALAPGEMVPSVRELARELALNPNTVARAYRELQARGRLGIGPRDRAGRDPGGPGQLPRKSGSA